MQIQIIKIQITYIAEIKKTKKTPKRIHVRKNTVFPYFRIL